MELELNFINVLMSDYNRRTPLDDIAMYTTPCSVLGGLSGFVGGLISSVITKEPIYMMYGASVGFGLGTIIGLLSSGYVAEAEYIRLHKRKQSLINQENS